MEPLLNSYLCKDITWRVLRGEVRRCLHHTPTFGLIFQEYDCPCAEIVFRPLDYAAGWNAGAPLFAAMTVPCELWDVDGVCPVILAGLSY